MALYYCSTGRCVEHNVLDKILLCCFGFKGNEPYMFKSRNMCELRALYICVPRVSYMYIPRAPYMSQDCNFFREAEELLMLPILPDNRKLDN